MRYLWIILALWPVSLSAQGDVALKPEEFDALTQGKTLSYSLDEVPFGTEEYRKNRRVRWAFSTGDCLEGSWYPKGQEICFVYDGVPEEQCWVFRLQNGDLLAEFTADERPRPVYRARPTRTPLLCLGPDIGV